MPDGLVVYQHGQIRFAPTHYTELAVLDTRTGTQKDIYPPSSPDKIRRERIERDSADYAAKGKDWCRENNHHCDPALFDNHLWSAGQGPSYIYDSSTAALAFSVIYGAHNDLIDVMVVCTGMQTIETIQCHETALEEWARTLGINSDDRLQLLKQAAIEPGRVMP